MVKVEKQPSAPEPLAPLPEQLPLPEFVETVIIMARPTEVKRLDEESDDSYKRRMELARNCFKLVATLNGEEVETRNVLRSTPLDELIPGLMFDIGQALLGVKSGPTVTIAN